MGNFFGDRHQFIQASRYYKLAENNEKLVDCYYNMEDYENLEKLANLLDERDPLIPKIASMFTSVGLCQQAVQCYLKVLSLLHWSSFYSITNLPMITSATKSKQRWIPALLCISGIWLWNFRRKFKFLKSLRVWCLMPTDF